MKKRIAILAGGDSSEWVVSVNSAAQVKEIVDQELFDTKIVFIRDNDWHVKLGDELTAPVNRHDFSYESGDKHHSFDCVLIMIHGTPGEDGKLQGYFDVLGIPYTTCGVLTSSLTFNKDFTKSILKTHGISVARSVLVKNSNTFDAQQTADYLGLPCFVKPNKGGSSFGVTKAKTADILAEAIEHALIEDDEVLIEEYLQGTEITCGLMKTHDKSYVFPITEIVSKNEFFDYEAKYTTGMADEITPARISPELEKECKTLSSHIYDLLECKGIVRIDYIYTNQKLYCLEINTVPGMSRNSIVPQQIRAMGLSEREIFTKLLQDVMD